MEHTNPMGGRERFGPFTLLYELGRGGQGTVWLAEDAKLGRKVALKVLNAGPASGSISDRQIARFRREAQAASKLDHPHICALLDAGDIDGVPYLAFRYVEGETLAERIDRAEGVCQGESSDDGSSHNDIDPSSKEGIHLIVHTLEKIARALHQAHEKGLIHRDVKPGNIMLTADEGEPVILDFGLAREELGDGLSLTHSGDLLGTPAYMSPEQLMANRVPLDRRTDIYSLGVTLYECLTLTQPFTGLTRSELYQQIQLANPTSAGAINRHIPRDLQVVLETAMEKDRNRRYQSALDFAEDLHRFRQFEPIRAKPLGVWLRSRRWVQRHPVRATAVGALMVSMTIALFLLQETRNSLELARSQGLAAESDRARRTNQMLGLLLALEGVNVLNAPHTLSALHSAVADLREQKSLELGGESFVRVSANGQWIVAAAQSGSTAWLWRNNDDQLRHLEGLSSPIQDIVFSSDSTKFAVGHGGGVIVYDVNPTSTPVTIPHAGIVNSVQFRPRADDQVLTSCSDGNARLFSIEGKELRKFEHGAPVWKACFSPDGEVLATAPGTGWIDHSGDNSIKLWLSDGSPAGKPLPGNRGGTRCMEFSADGRFLLSGGNGNQAILWDLESRETAATLRHRGHVITARFSTIDGGQYVLTGSFDGTAGLWSRAGVKLAEFRHDHQGLMNAVFSPKDRLVLTCSYDTTARIFAFDGTELAVLRGHGGPLHDATFAPDGNRIFTGSRDGTVRCWGIVPQGVPRLHEPPVKYSSVEFAPNSNDLLLLASQAGDVSLWSVGASKSSKLATAPGTKTATSRRGPSAAFSPDGRYLVATGPRSEKALLWPVEPGWILGKPIRLDHEGLVRRVGFSFSGDRVVTSSLDGKARIWNLQGRVIREFPHPDRTRFYVDWISVRGNRAVTCLRSSAFVWNINSGEKPVTIDGHENRVYSAELSPDGERILTASSDNTVRIWDARRKSEKAILVLNADSEVTLARYSRQGDRVIATSASGAAIVWDADTGEELYSLDTGSGGVRHVAFSDDGSRIATCGADGAIQVWIADPEVLIATAKNLVTRRFAADEHRRYRHLLGR